MVYNQEHDYLFVHIQKTAGSSITNFLLNQPNSLLINPPHLLTKDVFFKSHKKPFIFAVVRNPWERLVSWYEMMIRKGVHNDFSNYLLSDYQETRPSFSQFIRRIAIIHETAAAEYDQPIDTRNLSIGLKAPIIYTKSLSYNQLDYLVDENGQYICDKALRFDSLEFDWINLIRKFHPELANHSLPRLNTNPNHHLNWRNYYQDQRDIDWVSSIYQRDIDLFGFHFDDGLPS